ncbi:scarecrow-like protein 14 [Fagus crenata]
MDALLQGLPHSMNEFKFLHDSNPVMSNQNLVEGFQANHEFANPSDSSSSNSGSSLDGDSSENSGFSNSTVLKYISEILLEEDLEGKPCMLQDCLALQAAEKPFYDALGQKYPPSSNQLHPCFNQNSESPDDSFGQSSSFESTGNFKSSPSNTSENTLLVPDFYSEISFKQIKQGLPSGSNAFFDLDWNQQVPVEPKETTGNTLNGTRGRNNHQGRDNDYSEEGRSNKYSAVYADEPEPTELFDKVLLCQPNVDDSVSCSPQEAASQNGGNGRTQKNGQSKGSSGKTIRSWKQGKKGEIVDLLSLLTQCAQSVSSNDQRTTTELLKQIRQHSSPFGDGTQRMAHYFANGLEARLASQSPLYTLFGSNEQSAAEILKGYQVYISACPFKAMSNFYANRTILKEAEKAKRLHIIDFGILYGFQWPCLIQRLSVRRGGPPKLRITGIEFPQPGFRPAERVEETGRRLENYCRRFNVPFEYNVIAQKWETIRLEDLKIDRDEFIVVNCMYRLKNLPDEMVSMNSPRDTVLNLIKRINPDIFIHGVVNGTYNSPFFVSRFKEALFHFYALFDMFESTLPREDQQRMAFEKGMFARDAMNVIACEGSERVERPDTYKRWQVRNLRAGFRQLPLNLELFNEAKRRVKLDYHKDFVIDKDGQWMLQGWKGRIIHALSCWKPEQE